MGGVGVRAIAGLAVGEEIPGHIARRHAQERQMAIITWAKSWQTPPRALSTSSIGLSARVTPAS
jgi:hypothetical protein